MLSIHMHWTQLCCTVYMYVHVLVPCGDGSISNMACEQCEIIRAPFITETTGTCVVCRVLLLHYTNVLLVDIE